MTPEQAAQEILDHQKYLVVATIHAFELGDILPHLDLGRDFQCILRHKTVIVAVASEEEYRRQVEWFCRKHGILADDSTYPFYYKVCAE